MLLMLVGHSATLFPMNNTDRHNNSVIHISYTFKQKLYRTNSTEIKMFKHDENMNYIL